MSLSSAVAQTLQNQYLQCMEDALRAGKIQPEQAKKAAQDFMALLPFVDVEDAKQKLESHTQTYPEYAKAYSELIGAIDHEQTSEVIQKLQNVIASES